MPDMAHEKQSHRIAMSGQLETEVGRWLMGPKWYHRDSIDEVLNDGARITLFHQIPQ